MPTPIHICAALFALSGACVRHHVRASLGAEVRYYVGTIALTSRTTGQALGPTRAAFVRREISADRTVILECVVQGGEVFAARLTQAAAPLRYQLHDPTGLATGSLTFADARLTRWSYDLRVAGVHPGTISGEVAEGLGGERTPTDELRIAKLWNQEILMEERYRLTSAHMYETARAAVDRRRVADGVALACP